MRAKNPEESSPKIQDAIIDRNYNISYKGKSSNIERIDLSYDDKLIEILEKLESSVTAKHLIVYLKKIKPSQKSAFVNYDEIIENISEFNKNSSSTCSELIYIMKFCSITQLSVKDSIITLNGTDINKILDEIKNL